MKFPSIKQVDLLRLRRYIEADDLVSIEKCIADNPMWLLTSYDTPTILQLVFRFNAVHVAAKSGHAEVIKLIISYLESPEFWARIYPTADVHTANERRRHVLDLYLNSPETGSLSSPLHLASKFGHVECVRVLASHPATMLDLRDSSGSTALESACIRLASTSSPTEKSQRRQAICRALDERYVALVDRLLRPGDIETQPTILSRPLMGRQLHQLLASTSQLTCPGIAEFSPHLTHQMKTQPAPLRVPPLNSPGVLPFSPRQDPLAKVRCSSTLRGTSPSADGSHTEGQLDLQCYGAMGRLASVRAILGPLCTEEAQRAIERWRKPPHPFWAKLRLMDSEKGYERYGRRLAVEFATKWTENWGFLDDFADLRSQYGLRILNDYLSQFYNTDAVERAPFSPCSPGSLPRRKLTFETEVQVQQNSPKTTPIKRIRHGEGKEAVTATRGYEVWTEYREDNNPVRVLGDSLEETSSSSSGNSSMVDSERAPPTPKQMSPVIGILNSLIVSSPFRIILPDTCGTSNPILSRPERRVSMFSRNDAVCTPEQQQPRKSPGRSPAEATKLTSTAKHKSKSITRRRVVDGMWPSLIGHFNPDEFSTSHLQASITPAELGAHNALGSDLGYKQDETASRVDLEQFPFVKRWKMELDLSMHAV
ncbi:unnamed protein product [Mesocestoides corti]|nr:unnamed protein product [Mesocestoides corti]